MTTMAVIKNRASSNGDLAFTNRMGGSLSRTLIAPGEEVTVSVSGMNEIELTEFWPQRSPPASDTQKKGEFVDEAIAREVAVQVKMWGTDRPDNKSNELLGAALTSLSAVYSARTLPDEPGGRVGAFEVAQMNYYPVNWSPDAFRDYGSDFANLAVAAAFIRNQMLDMLSKGEDTTRSKRPEGYRAATPMMSAEAAGAASR